jgi:hypothetical protein
MNLVVGARIDAPKMAGLLEEPGKYCVFIGFWLFDGMDELRQVQHRYELHCLAKPTGAKPYRHVGSKA